MSSNKQSVHPFQHLLVMSEQLLRSGQSIRVQVGGNSMFPYIKKGEVIEIQPITIEKIKIGDVVVFHHTGKLIAHRVLKIKPDSLLTKGDSRSKFDPPVLAKNLLGKVMTIKTKSRKIDLNTKFRKKVHFLLAKISPFSFLLFEPARFVWHLLKKYK